MPVSEGELEKLRNVHGEFFGMELDAVECDQLAIQHVESDTYAKREPEFFKTKWFDYQGLHPTKATYLFAREYVRAYQDQMQVRYDVHRGQYMRPMKGGEDLFNAAKGNIAGVWKGRQTADAHGIPYDIYCGAVMRHAEETNWRLLPMARQLYSAKMVDAALEAWREEREVRLILPRDPRYLVENYTGAEDQDRFQKHLINQVLQRERPEFSLHHLIVEAKLLRREVAVEHFGEEFVATCCAMNLV